MIYRHSSHRKSQSKISYLLFTIFIIQILYFLHKLSWTFKMNLKRLNIPWLTLRFTKSLMIKPNRIETSLSKTSTQVSTLSNMSIESMENEYHSFQLLFCPVTICMKFYLFSILHNPKIEEVLLRKSIVAERVGLSVLLSYFSLWNSFVFLFLGQIAIAKIIHLMSIRK